jgi:hypothetical protein
LLDLTNVSDTATGTDAGAVIWFAIRTSDRRDEEYLSKNAREPLFFLRGRPGMQIVQPWVPMERELRDGQFKRGG